jgi:WD40 repeat protein
MQTSRSVRSRGSCGAMLVLGCWVAACGQSQGDNKPAAGSAGGGAAAGSGGAVAEAGGRGSAAGAPAAGAPAAGGTPATGAPSSDIVRSPDKLPSGAVAIIGAAALSSPSFVSDVALSSSGQLAMCGDRYARLWEVATGRLLWSQRAPGAGVRCALSPDGARLAVVSKGKSGSTDIAVHDWKTGTHADSVTPGGAPWFGLDGAAFVVARGGVEVRDTATNKAQRKASAPGIAAGLARDGALIVVGRTQVVRVKPDGASEPVATLPASIESAAVSADASRVAWTTGKQTGTVDVATGAVAPLPDPGGKVETLALSPRGDLLAVGIEGGLSVWELAGAKRLWGIVPKRRGLSPAVGFSPDGKSLVYTEARTAIVADARTGKAPAAQPRHFFAGWTPAGTAIVVDDANKKVALDLATGKTSDSFEPEPDPPGRPAWAGSVITGAGGVAMAYDDDALDQCAALKVWIAGKGERTLAKPRKCNEEHAGTWQPGPGLVVVNAPGAEVRDAVANKPLFKLDFGLRPLIAARFSSDGKRLLVVLGPGPAPENDADVYGEKEPRSGTRLEVWSIPDKKMLGALRVEQDGVTAAALDKAGARAYLGWDDGTVSLVDTSPLAPPRRLGVQPAPIQDLALSPDGAMLAGTDRDRSTTVWKP